jgi:hypothetical protein
MSSEATANPPAVDSTWRTLVRQPRFLCQGGLTVLLLVLSMRICAEFMLYAQARPGAELADPILNAVGPIRLRWPIFAVLWSSVIAGGYCLAKDPPRLLMGLQACALLIALRTIALYLVPLAPLPSIIPLADPVAIYFGTGTLVTKDLFFSGHTSVMFLLFLSTNSARMKWFLLAGTVFVGVGVVLQHVHYSGDVYAAPFFAYGSWRLVLLAHRRFN